MPAAWYRLRTDHPYNERWHGGVLSLSELQRQYWNPQWSRVEGLRGGRGDENWTVGCHKEEGVSSLAGQIRSRAAAVANCNARMISRSQYITD
jgi:hypothetical protein